MSLVSRHGSYALLEIPLAFHPPLKADGDAECSFNKLPHELICSIFELTSPGNLLQEYPWPTDSRPPTKLSSPAITYLSALAISAVCTRWRSLALALPRLWSQIRLEISLQRGLDIQAGYISTLRLYLDRSVDSPLRIDLVIDGGKPPNLAVLNLLLEHACRWQSFCCTCNYDLARCEGFSRHLSFPILEDLGLIGSIVAVQSTDFDCFQNAPKLRAVQANRLDEDSWLPWNQISSLEIGLVDCMQIQRCQNLTALTLRASSVRPGPGHISLAKLESLTFALDRLDSMMMRYFLGLILAAYTLPSLTDLIIVPIRSSKNILWPVPAFGSFISRSSCMLTTLSIGGVEISDLNLLATFRILPHLVNFAFDDLPVPREEAGSHPITSHLISCMHPSSTTASTLVPNLRSLSLTLHGPSFDDAAFTHMISSRWLPNPICAAAIDVDCLRSLVLRFWEREVDEDIYRPLYDLDRMGMRVIIVGESSVDY